MTSNNSPLVIEIHARCIGCVSVERASTKYITNSSQTSAHRQVLTDKCSQTSAHRQVLTDKCSQTSAHRQVLTDKCSQTSAHRQVLTDKCSQTSAHRQVLTSSPQYYTIVAQYLLQFTNVGCHFVTNGEYLIQLTWESTNRHNMTVVATRELSMVLLDIVSCS